MMNMKPNSRQEVKNSQEVYHFKKRLGSTTFNVTVHFNPNAKETAQDKIARLIQSEAAFGKAVNP